MMDGYALGHNCFRPHMAPGGKTLAEVAGIVIGGRDKTAIRTAARRTRSGEETKRREADGDRVAPRAR